MGSTPTLGEEMDPFKLQVLVTDVAAILPIRTKVLRPHFESGQLAHFDGDEDEDTFHVGAQFDGAIVGCASFMKRNAPEGATGEYQLRGMAVDTKLQGRGIGNRIVDVALTELGLRGATGVWCNAREAAVEFYKRTGFQIASDEFQIEGIGPHFVMCRPVPGALS